MTNKNYKITVKKIANNTLSNLEEERKREREQEGDRERGREREVLRTEENYLYSEREKERYL